MISWETHSVNYDEHGRHDLVLARPSRLGPWIAAGLGGILVVFLGYLVYANRGTQPLASASLARGLPRSGGEAPSSLFDVKQANKRLLERRRFTAAATARARATNALLGGDGPALPTEGLPEWSLPARPPTPSRYTASLRR